MSAVSALRSARARLGSASVLLVSLCSFAASVAAREPSGPPGDPPAEVTQPSQPSTPGEGEAKSTPSAAQPDASPSEPAHEDKPSRPRSGEAEASGKSRTVESVGSAPQEEHAAAPTGAAGGGGLVDDGHAPPAADAEATPPVLASPASSHDVARAESPPPADAEQAEPPVVHRPAEARYHGRVIHVFRAPLGELSPSERARAAVTSLEGVLDEPLAADETDEVTVRRSGDLAIIMVGRRKILAISPEDTALAGHPDVDLYAEDVRNVVEDFLARERSRKTISNQVLSWSLVVFFGLILFLAIPRVHRTVSQTRDWVRSHHDRMPTLTVQGHELVSRGAIQNLLLILVSALGIVLQIALVYVYLVVCFGLFAATSDWVPKLNHFVASPFRTLVSRVTDVFPTATLTLAVFLLLVPAYRIVGQIFDGVADGGIEWRVVPRHMARPLKQLFLTALVVGSILVLGPLVSDDANSLVARLAETSLMVLGVGLIPMAATFVWGLAVLLGKTYRRGAWLEAGSQSGVIDDVTLLEVVIRREGEAEGQPVRHRIPHLWLAFHPTTVSPKRPPMQLRFPVLRERHRAATAQQLVRGAQKVHPEAKVEIERVEADAIVYRVWVPRDGRATGHEILSALVAAIQESSSSTPDPSIVGSDSSSSSSQKAVVVPAQDGTAGG